MKNKLVVAFSFLSFVFFWMILPVSAETGLVSDSPVDSSGYSDASHALPGGIGLFLVALVIFMGLVGFIVYLTAAKTKERRNYEISEDELNEIFPDYTLNSLKEELYQRYLLVQDAYSNAQFDQLRELCSFPLSRQYQSELEFLQEKHGMNIMKDFELIDMKIQEIHEENDNVVVKAYLKNRYFDYTVDNQNTLVRGDYQNKIVVESLLTFFKKKEVGRKIKFCPRCGNAITDQKSGICSNCNKEVVKKNKFLLRQKGAFL